MQSPQGTHDAFPLALSTSKMLHLLAQFLNAVLELLLVIRSLFASSHTSRNLNQGFASQAFTHAGRLQLVGVYGLLKGKNLRLSSLGRHDPGRISERRFTQQNLNLDKVLRVLLHHTVQQ